MRPRIHTCTKDEIKKRISYIRNAVQELLAQDNNRPPHNPGLGRDLSRVTRSSGVMVSATFRMTF